MPRFQSVDSFTRATSPGNGVALTAIRKGTQPMLNTTNGLRPSVGRFELGRQHVKPRAARALLGQTILDCLDRHAKGDFGASSEQFDANLDAIANGGPVVSIHRCQDKHGNSATVVVTTAADRRSTSVDLARGS